MHRSQGPRRPGSMDSRAQLHAQTGPAGAAAGVLVGRGLVSRVPGVHERQHVQISDWVQDHSLSAPLGRGPVRVHACPSKGCGRGPSRATL